MERGSLLSSHRVSSLNSSYEGIWVLASYSTFGGGGGGGDGGVTSGN